MTQRVVLPLGAVFIAQGCYLLVKAANDHHTWLRLEDGVTVLTTTRNDPAKWADGVLILPEDGTGRKQR